MEPPAAAAAADNAMDSHNSGSSKFTKHESSTSKLTQTKDGPPVSDLWTNGLICAFEYVPGDVLKRPSPRRHPIRTPKSPNHSLQPSNGTDLPMPNPQEPAAKSKPFYERKWVPIGWSRIAQLVQKVQPDINWAEQQMDLSEDEDDYTVADVAAPYWERPVGPTWWCHVAATHPSVDTWLGNAQWLHPAIATALRDENRLISDRMKHLLYEVHELKVVEVCQKFMTSACQKPVQYPLVPVRVAGGLLFELLGQSVGDPLREEEDIPIVLRCWQAQNFLVSAMHVKGTPFNLNVLGITEVLELLLAGGSRAPRSVHEVIAHLTCRLSRWDDRLFRKYVFGEADEIELKFVNRRNYEDLNLLSIILNQEIKRLATQVIRVKWSLHAREEIVYELIQHLRGNTTRTILEGIKKSTRGMLEEQEAVRGRLFTIQDVMQSTVRAWLQDRSLRVSHNLGIFGGCGLVLSIITGLFGINVDGIPGAQNTPYAFGLFTGLLFLLGIILIGTGMIYLGLQNPISEEKVKVRKLELQQLVNMFQHDAEHHAKVREGATRHGATPNSSGNLFDADYILIQ